MTDVAARGLKPASVLALAHPHGTRIKYVGGCRCADCRAANSRYECERSRLRKHGDSNGIVSAATARAHILSLRAQGVGRRSIGAASDVSNAVLTDIIAQRKTQIRACTERKILAVTRDMAGDHALVAAAPTHRLIRELLAEGYTEAQLAARLGMKTPRLQLGRRRVLVKTAYLIELLHRRLTT